MERKDAIEIIKKNWPDSTFTMLREALETLIPELKESEDERICAEIRDNDRGCITKEQREKTASWFSWLEDEGEHAKFRNSIQVGDKVTRNDDGVFVNLSQLNRVAKKDEKQGEQNPAWSDEDESNLDSAIYFIRREPYHEHDVEPIVDWFKSLKGRVQPQNTWKPSDAQMKCISDVVADAKYKNDISTNGYEPYTHLSTLLQQLKKLRKE